jgi:3',5'-cyclic AMP phosphodiesterase CpdA
MLGKRAAPLSVRILLLAAAAHPGVTAYMHDTVISVPMLPPAECIFGCAVWSDLSNSHSDADQSYVDGLWADAVVERAAGSSCAIPANLGVPMGAACYCAGIPAEHVTAWGYCSEPAAPAPQQVNLQYGASGGELQVAWVTVDRGAPLVGAPVVEVCGSGGCANYSGRSTRAPEPQLPSRVLTYSFVPLPAALTVPGAAFSYRALPGAEPAAWSPAFSVRVPARSEPQRMAVFGDQGLYPYSSVGNLIDDARAGAIHAVLHLGDLAYNLAMANGSRGDAYMYALEPLLSRLPMIYVEGNHELEGSPFGSYCPAAENCEGRFLNQSAGYLVAGAASGSGTNRFYSLDVGLLHIVVYNTMQYLGLGGDMKREQLAWLRSDLARAAAPAQRARVPWILLATHVPMYCSALGEEGVGGGSREDIEPLLLEFSVDLYLYGHVHAYEATWPTANGTVTRSLVNPPAPVHVLSGAGGPPGAPDVFNASAPAAFSRATYSKWSYGRLTVHNATHLSYEQVDNSKGAVVDEFTLVQEARGRAR